MPLLLPFIIILIVLLSYKIKKSDEQYAKRMDAFWEREHAANLTRKQDIEHLDYITIPLKDLPFLENPAENIAKCQNTIEELSKKRILNLTGISNTDLKLNYGAANLNLLSEYDANFSKLSTTLHKWGMYLHEAGYEKEAVAVYEYAVSIHVDISKIYYYLAEYYKSVSPSSIPALIESASALNSIMKDSIINKLKTYLD